MMKQTLMVLIVGILALTVQAQPLAQYTFDDGNAVDVTGNGYDGILLADDTAAAVVVEDPNRGLVMQINGRGMQVNGPFDIRTSVTLSFWTKIDLPREGRFFSGGPWQFRTDNQSSSAHDWIEIRYPGGSFLNKADTRLGDPNSLGQLDGQWHHYAIVLNDAGDPKLYFDGVEAPLRDADKIRVHDFNGVDTIFFGTQNETGSNALQGCMDDIRIYNYAVAAGSIPELMGAKLAEFTFDDGTAADVTGNGYDGLLLGTPPNPADVNDPNVAAEVVEDPERGQVMQINGRGLQVDGPFDIRTSVSLTFWTKIDLPREGRFFSGGPWQFRTDNQSSSAHDWVEIRYPGGSFLNKADTRLGDPNSLGQLDGQWHHYAIVLNDAGDPKLYFDGVEAPLRDADKIRVHDFNGVDTIFFGTQNETGSNALQGCMDDIAIYNAAISADAVADIMLATTPIILVETMDSIEATGSDGDLIALDGLDVNALVLASLAADFEKFADHPAVDGENFSLATYASLDDAGEIIMMFPQAVNVVFLIERNGNDKGFLQALDADGVPFGALTHFAASDWLKTAYTIAGGQVASGIRLIADRPIYGVRVTPDGTMGLDPVSVSGIPVVE
ncbi:LamG-like jellyroll fold domain-containing protein [Planctomycetota bacterium]